MQLDRPDGRERRRAAAQGPAIEPSLLDIIPADAGPRLATSMGGAVYSIRPPGAQVFQAKEHFVGIMLAPAPGINAAFGSDKRQLFNAPRGMIAVNPAHWDSRMSWPSTRENAVIGLRAARLDELAAEEFDLGNVELRPPPFETVDPVALNAAELLKAELAQDAPTSELYVDSLLTVFAIHLLRNYTSANVRQPRAAGGLSVRAAKMLEDFLEENFARRLTVAELAAVCGLSPGHFIRAFTRTFGRPPHQYLLDRRLAFAEKLLTTSDMTIAAIAQLSGFSSQSHLTVAMRRHRHVTPARLRHGR